MKYDDNTNNSLQYHSRLQRDLAKRRHSRQHSFHFETNTTNHKQDHINQYVPYNQRTKYLAGDPKQQWSSKVNPAGWSPYDMSDPYNPKSPYYKKKHHKWGKRIIGVLIVCCVALGGWGAYASHQANQQSTQPNNKPSVVRKTIIEKQPQNTQSGNNKGSQSHNQNIQNQIKKLQADLQNMKMSNNLQQKLLGYFGKQNDTAKQQHLYDMANFASHAMPTNNLKRMAVNWLLNH